MGKTGEISWYGNSAADAVIKPIPVNFGKCTTQHVSNGDQSKAEIFWIDQWKAEIFFADQ